MDHAQLTISSEDDAWNILQRAMDGAFDDNLFDFKFDNWPILRIKLKGEQFQSTMTTTVMESFIELQKTIYRGYAELKYGAASAKRLTTEEKQALEIVVKVEQGSSDLTAMLANAAMSFGKEAAKKMEAKHIITVVLGTALIWGGTASYNNYLDNQVEQKQLEIQTFSSQEETKRMEIMKEIVADRPVLQVIQQDADHTYAKILKNATAADSVEIAGNIIQQETVVELAKTTREHPKEVRLDGPCKIRKVDSSKLGKFIVYVEFLNDGRTFPAEVLEEFLAKKDKFKSLIRNAEWDKRPVSLCMNCKEKNGEITQATILDVEEIIEGQDPV
jgi:hypothetical protein